MGIYLNPNNVDFKRALNSEIYIDKSMLIECTNSKILTEQQFICVSRPRRFGKSMAANMIVREKSIDDNLVSVMEEIFEVSKTPFIFVIDEWDCIFRIHKNDVGSHTKSL